MKHLLKSSRSMYRALLVILVISIGFVFVRPISADGNAPILPPDTTGCFGLEGYGVALYGSSTGTVTVDPPGSIVGAYIEWVGVEDATPPGEGTSTLIINGTPVTGTLAPGAAGASSQPVKAPWYSWWASIGPSDGPFPGRGVVDDTNRTLTISGWDGVGAATNGATVTILYDTGADNDPRTQDCGTVNKIQILSGVDWYYHIVPGEELTELLVFTVPSASVERDFSIRISHAGTQAGQQTCRGRAIWMLAGSGSPPEPTAFDLVAIGTDGRGYGINDGVEILNDPFTDETLPCVPTLNPLPDHPYAPDHRCPDGAATCPYRATGFSPSDGGNVGPEWGVIDINAHVPAGATWLAFQLESEADQNGESGSWGVASFAISSPVPNAVQVSYVEAVSVTSQVMSSTAIITVLVVGILVLGIVFIAPRWHGRWT